MRDAVIAFAVLVVLMFAGRYVVARRLSSAGPPHVPSADGSFTLRPPRRTAVTLGVLALVPAGVLGLVTFQGWLRGAPGLSAGMAATLLAGVAAAYFFASAFRSRVIIRDTGMEQVGVLRRRVIGWPAVAKIVFNPMQRWFFLTISDGSPLWLRADIAGIGDFAVVALRRVKPAVLEAADPIVREVLEDLAAAVRKETGGG